MPEQNARKRIGLTAGLIILIVALFLIFIDEKTVIAEIRQANWRLATAALVMLVIGMLLYAQRWRHLLGGEAPLSIVFHAGNVGHLINILVPLRAGEPARIVLVGRGSGITIPQVTSSIAVERWFEQVMRLIALLGAVGLGTGVEATGGTFLGGLVFIGLALAGMILLTRKQEWVLKTLPVWLARIPRLTEAQSRRGLTDFLAGLAGVTSTCRLITAMGWSVLTWGSFLGTHLLAITALPGVFHPEQQLAVALGALALAPPSAPTQPGIYHASVVAPLAIVGYNTEALTAYAVLLHGLQILGMGVFGIWGFLRLRTSPREEASSPPG